VGGDGQGVVLRPAGELDLATVDPFRRSVADALREEPPALVVDLARVDFLDSSGIAVLAGALKTQRRRGGAMALVNARPIVRRALDLVGLGELFDLTGIPADLLD
jgi:anti-anti-sigma factor